ncbi:MAG: methyltransferase domain-containing protein [Burkholderiaceae bacterium]|jgi:SAM-dependent methyltransferase|nr:methyltransferase domain-containing protein [Burkholderiaceae bacterium]
MHGSGDDYFAMNRAGWDARVDAHIASRFYDVAGFLAGATSLREIELAEVGDVAGKRLLHLQCHFGLDTLSWARRGAHCTGVDLSPLAIERARALAAQAGLAAEFVCSNVLDYRADPAASFDIVFTSYGAVCWLPDLARWAEVVARSLVPGGRFHMVEFHPLHDLLAGCAYFNTGLPDIERSGTYTENGADVVTTLAVWAHPLSEVITALVGAGIRIERFTEYPFSPYDCFPGLVEREPSRFVLEYRGRQVPMVYGITGRRA